MSARDAFVTDEELASCLDKAKAWPGMPGHALPAQVDEQGHEQGHEQVHEQVHEPAQEDADALHFIHTGQFADDDTRPRFPTSLVWRCIGVALMLASFAFVSNSTTPARSDIPTPCRG